MSTKQSIKYAPGYHLYQDCLDDDPAPVYLQLHGVEVELKTTERGASISVTIPNETAVALGLLPPCRAEGANLTAVLGGI